jgi:hypothetical protein
MVIKQLIKTLLIALIPYCNFSAFAAPPFSSLLLPNNNRILIRKGLVSPQKQA